MRTIIKYQFICILCIVIFSLGSILNGQIRVCYKGDSLCVSNGHNQPICYKSNYLHYSEFLDKEPVYLVNKSSDRLYIYNPKIELIQFDTDAFYTVKRMYFHDLSKEYNVKLDFVGNNIFLQSYSRLLLYDRDLCLIGNFNDSLVNSQPSINELLVKDIAYHFDDSTIIFDITSYAKRTPKLDPDSLEIFEYSFRYK